MPHPDTCCRPTPELARPVVGHGAGEADRVDAADAVVDVADAVVDVPAVDGADAVEEPSAGRDGAGRDSSAPCGVTTAAGRLGSEPSEGAAGAVGSAWPSALSSTIADGKAAGLPGGLVGMPGSVCVTESGVLGLDASVGSGRLADGASRIAVLGARAGTTLEPYDPAVLDTGSGWSGSALSSCPASEPAAGGRSWPPRRLSIAEPYTASGSPVTAAATPLADRSAALAAKIADAARGARRRRSCPVRSPTGTTGSLASSSWVSRSTSSTQAAIKVVKSVDGLGCCRRGRFTRSPPLQRS
jgi:hypothetical protein